MTPTAQMVKEFWIYLSAHYDSEIKPKPSSDTMAAAAWFLHNMGIMDRTDFMERYTTTIGKTIYIPFSIGDVSRPYWNQISLGAHEHVHVWQYDREGAEFYTKYLLYKSERVTYEVQACTAELEIMYWRQGAIRATVIQGMVQRLRAYALDEGDLAFAQQYLESARRTVNEGGIITSVGQLSIKWLDEYAHWYPVQARKLFLKIGAKV